MTDVVCEMSFDELSEASGGVIPDGYCYTNGANGWGLYAGDGCGGGPTNAEVYKAFFDAFHKAAGR